jgi:hypothetical protein
MRFLIRIKLKLRIRKKPLLITPAFVILSNAIAKIHDTF